MATSSYRIPGQPLFAQAQMPSATKSAPLPPPDMPIATKGAPLPPPVAQPTAAPLPQQGSDPFGGQGVWVGKGGVGWVPKDHPAAQQAQPQPTTVPQPPPGMPAPPVAPGQPQQPPPVTPPPQFGAPQDISTIKGFFGGSPEAKQRSDELFNTLLNRSKQSLNIDRNDPIIRGQADTYRAASERAARSLLGDTAEGTSPFSTGALRGQRRMAAERLGQDVAGMEAELAGKELATRRGEIASALDSMQGMLSEEQERALRGELAQLDSAVQKYGVDTGAYTSQRGQDIQKYGIDTNLLSDREQRELQRYGIDVGAKESAAGRETQRYGIDVGARTSRENALLDAMMRRYGIDVGAQGERDRLGFDIGREEADQYLAQLGLR